MLLVVELHDPHHELPEGRVPDIVQLLCEALEVLLSSSSKARSRSVPAKIRSRSSLIRPRAASVSVRP